MGNGNDYAELEHYKMLAENADTPELRDHYIDMACATAEDIMCREQAASFYALDMAWLFFVMAIVTAVIGVL